LKGATKKELDMRKAMKQLTLVDRINRLIPEAAAVEDGDSIYFMGSEDYERATGIPIFDYWNQGDTFGVNPKLNKILDDAGWFAEPLDAGTLKAYN
jgi:hypothetical protein